MTTIWKFPFAVGDDISIKMPACAEVLSVGVQDNTACVWARVDPAWPERVYHFRMYGTGHPLNPHDVGRFVGTIQMAGGALVFHVFEAATASVEA